MPTVKPFPIPSLPKPGAMPPAADWPTLGRLADAVADRALANLPSEQRHLEAALLARGLERAPSARVAVQASETALRAARADLEATGRTSDALMGLLYALGTMLYAAGLELDASGVWEINPVKSRGGPLVFDVADVLDVVEVEGRRVAA